MIRFLVVVWAGRVGGEGCFGCCLGGQGRGGLFSKVKIMKDKV